MSSLILKDITLFIAFAYDEKRKDTSNAPSLELFKEVKAIDLLTISEEGSLLWTFTPDASWNDTIDPFSKGIHRALVKDGMLLHIFVCGEKR